LQARAAGMVLLDSVNPYPEKHAKIGASESCCKMQRSKDKTQNIKAHKTIETHRLYLLCKSA
jgi:hypothetical protein